MRSVWPDSVAMVAPDATSHSRAVPSADAVATRVPSGLKTALLTPPSCPDRTASRFPDHHPITALFYRAKR